MEEIFKMKQLKHDNIVRLIDYHTYTNWHKQQNEILMFQEYADLGDLKKYL